MEWHKDPRAGTIELEATVLQGVPALVRLPGLEPVRYASGGGISLTSEIDWQREEPSRKLP